MASLREIWLKKSAKNTRPIGKSKTVSWDRVKHLGVILYLENQEVYRKMLEMQDRLESENPNLRVHFLFYLKEKEAPDYLVATHHNFILKKHLGWNGHPKKDAIRKWLDKEFQVLINASSDITELRILFKLTPASFRVSPQGKFSKEDADLILQTEKSLSLREQIETIIYYLKIIKPHGK